MQAFIWLDLKVNEVFRSQIVKTRRAQWGCSSGSKKTGARPLAAIWGECTAGCEPHRRLLHVSSRKAPQRASQDLDLLVQEVLYSPAVLILRFPWFLLQFVK